MRVSVRPVVLVLALIGVGAPLLWAADPPYAGSWKLNPARSDFGEMTVTYEELGDGQMKVTSDGQSYTFRADGNEYPTPWGSSAAWASPAENTWTITNRVDGKIVGRATLVIGSDGGTLNVDATSIDASGQESHNTAVYQRVSGGPGLPGKWKTENLEIGSPGTLSINSNGSDGLTLTFVEEKGTCRATFDGEDHPATGPVWPSGWTCALAKTGATGFQVTWKKDGKVMYEDALTLSDDGKTLTDVGTTPGTGEKVKAVYERQ